ncbi:MAG TPA: hypothetical protein PKD24_05955 [Pyrinomonadaceae bacterium]|nr:hypothetical protein [Pyrinomonadaceae bacterium]HMP65301.1 hypothetical protein [Pyrinomonadaceae bacterium]
MKRIVHKRVNITLPEETIAILESVADKGDRSSFIDEAIRLHAKKIRQKSLRQRLKQGAIARADRDLAIADEWFALEEESWQK